MPLYNPLPGAWIAYTPTITAGTGTFTTVAGAGRYQIFNKTVFFQETITITTNGTAAGTVVSTIPVTAQASSAQVGSGRGNIVSGNQLQVRLTSTTQLTILNYNNTYPGATGETLLIEGTYEAA